MAVWACGNDDRHIQDVLPETAGVDTVGIETDPDTAADGSHNPIAEGGLRAGDLSLGLRAVELASGWTVDVVEVGSPAEVAGIQERDLVRAIHGPRFDDISATTERKFRDELSSGAVEVTVERNGQPLTLVVQGAPSPDVLPLYFPDIPSAVQKAASARAGCYSRCVGEPGRCAIPAPFGLKCSCAYCVAF